MREFQIYLENDIKANDPYISKYDLNEKVKRLIIGIENEIGEELRQKFPEISEKDISKRVKNIGVKGNDMNKEQWLVSYIVIFLYISQPPVCLLQKVQKNKIVSFYDWNTLIFGITKEFVFQLEVRQTSSCSFKPTKFFNCMMLLK